MNFSESQINDIQSFIGKKIAKEYEVKVTEINDMEFQGLEIITHTKGLSPESGTSNRARCPLDGSDFGDTKLKFDDSKEVPDAIRLDRLSKTTQVKVLSRILTKEHFPYWAKYIPTKYRKKEFKDVHYLDSPESKYKELEKEKSELGAEIANLQDKLKEVEAKMSMKSKRIIHIPNPDLKK